MKLVKGLIRMCLIGLPLVASAQQELRTYSYRDSLVVEYQLPLVCPASDYATVSTPLLCGRGDTLRLEPVTVRGARNARLLHRDYVLNRKGDEPPYLAAATMPAGVSRRLCLLLDEYPWLRQGDLQLQVVHEEEGCCSVKTLQTVSYPSFAYQLPFHPEVKAVADRHGRAAELEISNPVLAHISSYRPYDDTRILRREKGMLYVHFPLDKADIRRDYRQNADVLDRIVQLTREVLADTTNVICKIQIIGLASVEGPVKRNQWLSEQRAEALRRYVQERVSLPDSLFELSAGGEAWTELRDQVEEQAFEGSEEILRIISEESDVDRRERLMKRHNGGKTYRYLLQNVLLDQRNSGYLRIYYDYVPDEAAAAINRASELLRQERYSEALDLLQPYREDERALNALGVALYQTGHEEEAIACFRRAAAAGNEQARKNLLQLRKE